MKVSTESVIRLNADELTELIRDFIKAKWPAEIANHSEDLNTRVEFCSIHGPLGNQFTGVKIFINGMTEL